MTEIYVSPTGSDSAAGTAAAPLRTIGAAVSRMGPGVEVIVRAGTYAEALTLSRGGSASAWAIIRADAGTILRPPSSAWNGISIAANYLRVEGFTISGARGDGIEGNDVHHVEVVGNKVSGSGESGIQFNYSDWITVEGNETFGNASTGWFSGISIYQNRDISGDASPGWRTIIRGNISHANVTKGGQHTDGNGIIVDDFRSTQNGNYPAYDYPTLVEGNLCYGNGGKGIQVTWSDKVTVRNNTLAENNVDAANDGTWRGDLSISESQGCLVSGNIVVCKRGSGRLASNRAIGDTSQNGRLNRTTFAGNVAWDPAGVPSLQNDGGNPAGSAYGTDAIRWLDPQLGADWLPRAAAAAGKGWRGSAAPEPTPTPEPEPEPEPAEDIPYRVHSIFAGMSPTRVFTGEGPLELGTKFRFAAPGRLTGLRLYRLAGNGSATIRVWRSGKVVARGFVQAGGEGWAQAAVDLAVAAGDEIIVSWGKAKGRAYPAVNNFFDSDRAAGAITAFAGLFAEKAGALPTKAYRGSFYWTDVRFERS